MGLILVGVVELSYPTQSCFEANVATKHKSKNNHQQIIYTGNRVKKSVDLYNVSGMLLNGHIQSEIKLSN